MSKRGAFLAAVLLGGILGGVAATVYRGRGVAPAAGAPTLQQETRRLETEVALAASKKPFLVLDLPRSRLDYRLGGMVLKSIPFQIDSILEHGRDGVLIQGKLMVLTIEDRGAPPEVIVPPDPDKPVDPLKDPKLFPPDPPDDYTLLCDHSVKVRFLGEEAAGWKVRMQGMGRAVRGWLPWGPGGGKAEIRIQLRLPAERSQEIYRALYQGEKLLVLGLGTGAPVETGEVRAE